MQFVEEQAIDRVHRLNQTVDVVVYKITIQNTVEERILALQEKKRELANAAIEGKAVGKLSIKDIMQLFRRDVEPMPSSSNYAGGNTTNAAILPARPTDGSVAAAAAAAAAAGPPGHGPRMTAPRSTPPVSDHSMASGGTREGSVYDRRW